MPIYIEQPTIIKAVGNKEKSIREFIGHVNTKTNEISIAQMISPQGWEEPGQQPLFDEYTIVLKGTLKVITKEKEYLINAGQAIIVQKGEWVKYCTPLTEGAEYIAICLPAFSPGKVNRDA